MVILYNHPKLKGRRKELRNNQTEAENLLWEKLRRNQLGYKFKRQHSIGRFILDFYCPEKKLAIELDGAQHLENKQYDKEREAYLSEFGIKTLRFWNSEVTKDLNSVIQKIVFAF